MDLKLTTGGANRARVQIGSVVLFFSYESCIAFEADGEGWRDPAFVKLSASTEAHATVMGCKAFPAARDQRDFRNSLVDALGDLPHV